MSKLLVIDDEPDVCRVISKLFEAEDVEVTGAATAEEGIRAAREQGPNAILLDIKLDDRSGLEVFHELRRIDSKAVVIFITGHGTADTAIEAMKHGAHDYLVKPLDLDQLERVVRQALQISRLMHVPAVVEAADRADSEPDRLVGSGPTMQAIGKEIGRVATQDVNVLILGESGTGKELVARAIYHNSRRADGPFLAINCAAIPETLLESELFGHEKGAFTGADRRRIGKFEQCNGGTLLLDEIGDMAHNLQAKLLRILEQHTFERVGGQETMTADVRILASTNQNLESLIEQSRFRKDLYYRLRGVCIHLPALRERREDIPRLAQYFLFRYGQQSIASVQSIAPETLDLLMQYHWPGNIRELQIVIREALLRASGSVLLPEFLSPELLRKGNSEGDIVAPSGSVVAADWQALADLFEKWVAGGESDLYRRALDHFDRLIISRILADCGGSQTEASERLGLSRVTLRTKLRAAHLAVGKVLSRQGSSQASGAEQVPD